jgi:hypothetical protein
MLIRLLIGKAPVLKIPAARINHPHNPSATNATAAITPNSSSPELKVLLESLCQRTACYSDYLEASDKLKRAQSSLNKPLQTEFHSERSYLRLHIDQAKDRQVRCKKKLEEIDKKLFPTIAMLLEKQSKQSHSTEVSEAQVANLVKAAELAMDTKFDLKTTEQNKALEKLQKSTETAMNKKFEQRTTQQETAMTELKKATEAAFDKKLEQSMTLHDAKLDARLEQKMRDLDAAVDTRFAQKMKDMDVSLRQRLEQKLAEQDAAVSKYFEEKMKGVDATVAEQNAAMSKQMQQNLTAQDLTVKSATEDIPRQIETHIAKQLQQKVSLVEERLKVQRETEKAKFMKRFQDEVAKTSKLAETVESLKLKVNRPSSTQLDRENQLSKQASLDIAKLEKLESQATAQRDAITNLQSQTASVAKLESQANKQQEVITELQSQKTMLAKLDEYSGKFWLAASFFVQSADLRR